ncbi:MAG TPA: hypothetical protein VNI01_15775 [Elusimicrobiota bacterium]|nr:hypothetical protein [Elusimicrobiota bacterium]
MSAAPPPIDEEEVRARQAMRAHLRSGGKVLAWLGILVAALLASVQARLAFGPRPAVLGVPLLFYVACAARFWRQRSPGMIAFCLVCAWATVSLVARLPAR